MSTLVCHVRCHLPIAEIAVAGTLDDSTVIHVGAALTDCLADQPDAVILDLAEMTCHDDRLPSWLHGWGRTAHRWPGSPLLVVAPGVDLPSEDGIVGYGDVGSAKEAANAVPLSLRRSIDLPPLPSSCAAARDLAEQACRDFGAPRLAQLVRLLTSELTANAVVHARTRLRVSLRRQGGSVYAAVRDGDPFLPQLPGPDDPGSSLELVMALASDWGSLLISDGKVVWVRVDLPA
ncbi:ATP-binding protein [Catellatospora tritici]|uniref:ATP-binding protein n=1 Tax=Catellatospora tritici TaxID=2851566 RepID=UPI001C2D6BB5|nr:ATP-binding protein [Catellatospora tritici]MBV1853158.1 ATP-binding protein [Catellatospora tritici]